MEIITKQMEMNQTAKRLIDQFVLDEDYNVPDAKNDVKKVIASKGELRVDETKPVENYLRIQGEISFRILYVAEGIEPTFSCLEGKIPYVEMVYLEEGMGNQPQVRRTNVELSVQLIHSRKLRIKAMAELTLEREKERMEDIPVDVSSEWNIFKKEKNIELLRLHTTKKDTCRIKEEILLTGTKESIGTMLWSEVSTRRLETKLAMDELQINGELLVFCFYESPDGKIDWIEQAVPYQGRVMCDGVDETMYHHAQIELNDVHTDVRADEDGELRCIGIEGTWNVFVTVYEEEHMDVLEDFYSLERKCELEWEPISYEQLVVQNHSKCKVMERIGVPELHGEVLQICHSGGTVRVDRMQQKEDGVLIEGALYFHFLFVKTSDEIPFDIWEGVVPFSHLVECGAQEEELNYHISSILEQLSVTLQGGDEIEVKAVLAFHGCFRKVETMEMIQSVKTEMISREEIEKRPGMIGYMVKEGDDLWKLAKRYYTCVDTLKSVNDITDETLKPGTRFLIFKENMGIM